MRRLGSSPFAFPDFRGATRTLVFANLGAYFALLILQLTSRDTADTLLQLLAFEPQGFLHGWLWQPLTYSFIHPPEAIVGTLLELLSLWFLAGFLETLHTSTWVNGFTRYPFWARPPLRCSFIS